MAESLLFDVINRGVQAVLSVDPDTSAELGALNGKVFCINLTTPPASLHLKVEPGGLSVALASAQPADVTLEGSIFAFAKLGGKGGASQVVTDGQVKMDGDVEAGQAFQKILAKFDFDWEELIARLVGDTPARKIGNLVRSTIDWADHSADLSQQNFADYLTEEKRMVVSQMAMDRFAEEVNQLRADTDRLAIRIDRLRQTR